MNTHSFLKRTRFALAAAVMSAGLVLAAVLPASATTYYPAGNCSSQGGFATCTASGTGTDPYAFYVHYATWPRQSLTVYWSIICVKGSSSATNSGHFNASGKGWRWVRHPLSKPDSCDIAALGSLNHTGWIHIWNIYDKWS